MSAPVKQAICDHDWTEVEGPVADPSPYTVDDDWRWVGFEFGGAW